MTVLELPGAAANRPTPAARPGSRAPTPRRCCPDAEPYRVLGTDAAAEVDPELLPRLYAELVRGRRYNAQATALTKQGRLAVYPSSTGQEACEIAAALVLEDRDWLFPSYRDTLAAVARGLDPVEALTLLRGDWHTGYDPREHRIAPLCTPLATQLPHAVGLAHAARLKGDDVVALAMVGDGGTSEGDFHEALNFAAVWQAPVVFLVQNNGFAISVPLAKQTAAPSLAHKAVGYGMPGRLVDGNDAAAMHQVLSEAVPGPARAAARRWSRRSPTAWRRTPTPTTPPATAATPRSRHGARTTRCRFWSASCAAAGCWTTTASAPRGTARAMAADLREQMNADPALDPMDLFTHVYAEQTSQLREQAAQLRAELDAGPTGAPRAAARRGDDEQPLTATAAATARKPATMAQALSRALRDAMAEDPTGPRPRRGRRHARRRLPGDRRPRQGVRRGPLHRTPRWPRPASSAPPSAWRCTGCGPWSRCSSTPSPTRRSSSWISHVAKMRNRTRGALPMPLTDPRPVRRRHRRGRAPQRLLRGVLPGHPRAARRHPGDRRRTPTGCCARRSPPTTRWSSWSPSGCTGPRPTGRPTRRTGSRRSGRAAVRRRGSAPR